MSILCNLQLYKVLLPYLKLSLKSELKHSTGHSVAVLVDRVKRCLFVFPKFTLIHMIKIECYSA